MYPLIKISDSIFIESYWLFLGVAIGVLFQMSKFQSSIKKNSEFKLVFIAMIFSAWIGSKLAFVFFDTTAESFSLLLEFNFWTGGGAVFLGSFVGGVLFLILLGKIKSFKYSLQFTESLSPGVFFAHGIGRIGCFMAGCCYGKISDVSWIAHHFPHGRIPVQLIESVLLFTAGIIQVKKKYQKISFYLVAYGLIRITTELMRGDTSRGLLFNTISYSFIISFLMLIIGLVMWRKHENIHKNR